MSLAKDIVVKLRQMNNAGNLQPLAGTQYKDAVRAINLIQDRFNNSQFYTPAQILAIDNQVKIADTVVVDDDYRAWMHLGLLTTRGLCYWPPADTLSQKQNYEGWIGNSQKIFINRNVKVAVKQAVAYEKHNPTFDFIREVPSRWRGSNVHAYDQALDDRRESQPNTLNGWCLGMAVRWLYFQSQPKPQNFWVEHKDTKGPSVYRFAMNVQTMTSEGTQYSQANSSVRAKFEPQLVTRYKFRRSGTVPTALGTAVSTSGFASAVSRCSNDTYIMICQYYKGGGGHAMAAYADKDGHMRFMDPNLGEVEFPTKSSFENWYPEFLRYQQYKISKYFAYQYKAPSP